MPDPSAHALRQEPPAGVPQARGRFGAASRLVAKADFSAALRGGRRARGAHVQLIAAPRRTADRPAVPSRLGLSVSKGVGNAPQRARLRRLLREAFRSLRGRLKESCDVVVIAKTPWPEAGLAEVAAEVDGLLARMRLAAPPGRGDGERP